MSNLVVVVSNRSFHPVPVFIALDSAPVARFTPRSFDRLRAQFTAADSCL